MKVIHKFDSRKPLIKLQSLPFSYFSTIPLLDYSGYVLERNEELILVAQDIIYNHEFPAIFLPKKIANWQEASITAASSEDIKKLRKNKIEIIIQKSLGSQFFYKTKSLLDPAPNVRRRIEQFKKNYEYKVANSWPKEKIKDFYWQWKKQKKRTNENFIDAEKFFFFCLDNLKKYQVKQVYVIVNKKLVGFAWGLKHQSGNWIGLHLKVNYRYKGLSRFLHQERAKLFSRYELFTLGTGAQEPGVIQFKKELGPTEEQEYFYVLTGRKKLGK